MQFGEMKLKIKSFSDELNRQRGERFNEIPTSFVNRRFVFGAFRSQKNDSDASGTFLKT